MSAVKIIKIPGGEAYIEIGEDYIRIGAGKDSYIVLDKASMNAGAKNVNWQMSPEKMTYFGLLSHQSPLAGFSPISPKYSLSDQPLSAFSNLFANAATISAATNIGL